MGRLAIFSALFAVAAFVAIACSESGLTPVTPTADQDLTAESTSIGQTQTHLWGYYDVFLDIESKSVVVVPNRSTMFAANIVTFLNTSPGGLEISFNGTSPGPGYVDVDLDVTINHPLDNEKFNGYDVRGIFIGDGSGILSYNTDLKYPVHGTDQILLNADGYSRWFNPSEFTSPGIFGYVPGNFAPPGYTGSATLNPYKYFGEGLGATDNLWSYLTSGDPHVGYFLHGTGNTRNYVIRFPIPLPGIKYGYAVVANWEGGPPEFHPAHAPETVGCKMTDYSNLYYIDPTNNGGNLILHFSVCGWVCLPMNIYIESSVLSSVYMFTSSDMLPVSGGDNFATYYVEIPADNVTGIEGQEFWLIVEYGYNYTNDFGVPNEADIDRRVSCFRFDVPVSDEIPGLNLGWAQSWGGTSNDEGEGVAVDHFGNVYVTGYFSDTVDLDPGEGADIQTSNGEKDVYLSKFNTSGEFQWARVWGGLTWDEGRWVDVDGSGNVYVAGYYGFVVDFDPGPGVDKHTCIGGIDAFLSKFDPSGNFQWVRTWGGSGWDEGRGVAIDDSMNVYVAGHFSSIVDFDPGDGIDNHNSNGNMDAYISMFDSDGGFQWARTWGGPSADRCYGIAVDGSGNAYVAGYYALIVEFDPVNETDEHSSVGENDIFLSKFDPSGDFQWARTWGGLDFDEGYGIASDDSGNCFVTGMFHDSVDFNPGTGTDIHISNGDDDVFLSMFDSSGNFLWARTWGGLNVDVGYGAAVDISGNAYVTGIFMSDVDFDPSAQEDLRSSNGSTDIFLSKFDFIGEYQDATTWGGIDGDLAFSVTKDNWENTFVAGYFLDEVDFAPTGPPCYEDPDEHTSTGERDAFLTKHQPDGCW